MGSLHKGGEPGTLRGVSNKGEGTPRRSDSTPERLGTKSVSGAFLVTNSVGALKSYGKFSLADCLSTGGSVTEVRPMNGSVLRETASKRVVIEESLDILGKMREGVEGWNKQREEIIQVA